MADEILTVVEVAQLLKVVEETVYTRAQDAELPCSEVRDQWPLWCQGLDTWMASRVARAAASEEPAPKGKTPTRKGVRR
ncbi:hypothetical protein WME91_41865 [Sorangium sp. So ce269]